jgi:hypothetical protein
MKQVDRRNKSPKWVVVHNGVDYYRLVYVEATLQTGQPFADEFDTLDEVRAAFGDKVEYPENEHA